MIGLIGAELLKLRKRWATYIVPAIGIILMGLIYLLVASGPRGSGGDQVARFPTAYSFINQFVFGLGSLLAIAYTAAIGGADWTWGIMRVVIARGEGRGRYVLAKAIGLAIVLIIGSLVAIAFGIGMALLVSKIGGRATGNPFGGEGLLTLLRSVAYGSVVLLERAAIGFAVAFLLRSQLAGVVVGIVLYIGEGILSTILTVMVFSASQNLPGVDGGFNREIPTQWFQFLPFSIGNSLLSQASTASGSDLSSVLLTPVGLGPALAVTGLYLLLAMGIAVIVTKRAEIRS